MSIERLALLHPDPHVDDGMETINIVTFLGNQLGVDLGGLPMHIGVHPKPSADLIRSMLITLAREGSIPPDPLPRTKIYPLNSPEWNAFVAVVSTE